MIDKGYSLEGVFRKKRMFKTCAGITYQTRLCKVGEGPSLRTADGLVLLYSCSWMWLWFKSLDVCGEPVHVKVRVPWLNKMTPHFPIFPTCLELGNSEWMAGQLLYSHEGHTVPTSHLGRKLIQLLVIWSYESCTLTLGASVLESYLNASDLLLSFWREVSLAQSLGHVDVLGKSALRLSRIISLDWLPILRNHPL